VLTKSKAKLWTALMFMLRFFLSENLRGWLKRRPLPGSHGNSKVELLKARIAYCLDV